MPALRPPPRQDPHRPRLLDRVGHLRVRDPTEHVACTELACGCWCHDYGRKSHPALGVAALWDGDTAGATHGHGAPRGDWIIDDPHTIRRAPAYDDRKTA